ncbi:MAG TPA: hypothetical protein VFD43_07985, partial [Planctomycetota bacterium]|nr:hypothetical protein [Planctomycetota bacterium]
MPFALSTDFFQAANLGPPVGEIDWIGSILQQNNSIYAEGMSVPQRLVFLEIDPTAGNVHTLTFSHQATKGGDVHAYDFLTSWAQAIEAGKGHGPNDEDLLDELADPNVIVLSASGQAATDAEMESLWFPANSPEIGLGDITPDAMPNVGGGTGDVAAQISAYEANPLYGNRQVTVRAPDGFPVTNVSCDFTGYSPSGADFFAEYSLTWTSESPTIGIEFAGHLGVGISDGVVPGYGTGFGASNVSGGPYHFKLGLLDTKSLGSIDNQIKGADIIIDPPGCDLSGPTPVCEDATGLVYTNGVFDPAITYAWTFVSNTSGASFTSATNTNTVTVDAGGTSGGFTLQLSKTNAGGTTLCQFPVIVNPTTVVDDIADQSVCPDDPVSFTAVASGTGTLTYAWTKDGAPIGGNTATLDLGAVDEADEGEYCVTVTGDCGSDSDCATLTVRAPTVVDAIADQSVCPGTGVSFTASATGDGTLTYAWTKDGAPIGGNTATLDLGPVDESDEGEYCVTVTGGCGADSDC